VALSAFDPALMTAHAFDDQPTLAPGAPEGHA
jgi:hypothetical protein